MTAILFGIGLLAIFVLVVFVIGYEAPPPGASDFDSSERNSEAILEGFRDYIRQAEIEAFRIGDGAPSPRRVSGSK
jgi:hypothetical protein